MLHTDASLHMISFNKAPQMDTSSHAHKLSQTLPDGPQQETRNFVERLKKTVRYDTLTAVITNGFLVRGTNTSEKPAVSIFRVQSLFYPQVNIAKPLTYLLTYSVVQSPS